METILLSNRLPDSVEIHGKSYPINTDYRIGIQVESILLDSDMSDDMKVYETIRLYFDDMPPLEYAEEIIKKIIWFYTGHELEDERRSQRGNKPGNGLYFSYIHDADKIAAAFMQQYGVDITEKKLHWWKFRAMFNSLSEDTQFVKVVGYRAMQIPANMPRKQKEFYKKMKKIHALPLPVHEQKKVDYLEEVLLNGGNLENITERYYQSISSRKD